MIALLIIFLFCGLIILAAGCINPEPPIQHIEPRDLIDVTSCAWCAKERGNLNPNDSHGVCKRHAAIVLEQHKQISKAA